MWTRLPLATALAVARKERLMLGWAIARVDLLRYRPFQCYRFVGVWGTFGPISSACNER